MGSSQRNIGHSRNSRIKGINKALKGIAFDAFQSNRNEICVDGLNHSQNSTIVQSPNESQRESVFSRHLGSDSE